MEVNKQLNGKMWKMFVDFWMVICFVYYDYSVKLLFFSIIVNFTCQDAIIYILPTKSKVLLC